MKEKLEKILEGTKQFVKSKVGIGVLVTGLALSYVSCGEDKDFSDCETGDCCNEVYQECTEDCGNNNSCIEECAHDYYSCVNRVAREGSGYSSGSDNGNGSSGGGNGSGGNGSGCLDECSLREKKCDEEGLLYECVERGNCAQWDYQKGYANNAICRKLGLGEDVYTWSDCMNDCGYIEDCSEYECSDPGEYEDCNDKCQHINAACFEECEGYP